MTLAVNDLGEGFALTARARSPIDARCEYVSTCIRRWSRWWRLWRAIQAGRCARWKCCRRAERRQLLYEWNATEAEYPRERCVHELFEEQVEKTPDAVAVVL